MEMALATGSGRRRARNGVGARLRAALTLRRLAFGLAICLLVSTSVLFQPHFYRLFVFEAVARSWLDYFGECLLMGAPIMLALTLAEVATHRRSQLVAVPVAFAALVAGAALGTVLGRVTR